MQFLRTTASVQGKQTPDISCYSIRQSPFCSKTQFGNWQPHQWTFLERRQPGRPRTTVDIETQDSELRSPTFDFRATAVSARNQGSGGPIAGNTIL
jgi:hypothetical protein